MTAIVGVFCSNGVVIGADSSATFVHGQYRTIEQPFNKIDIIGGHVIVAGTGSIGLGQRFCNLIKNLWEQKQFQNSEIDVAKCLSRGFLTDLQHTFLNPGQYGALVAFPIRQKTCLCEFQVQDFQPELKNERLWYVSMGSAQPIMDPFLGFFREVFWHGGPPDLNDGIFAVTWALEHAIALNPGGVNGPINLAVLEKDRKGQTLARMIEETELDEVRQHIEEAKNALRQFRNNYLNPETSHIPEIPKLTK